MQTKITTKFGQLLARPELLVMSGGFSPLHARMSEVLGYEAFFMSGSQVAAYVYGYPDVGLLGLSEMVESVRRITNVGAMPIFSDADTGYGNAVNVYHTVQAYIRAGAAGLHIEDQDAPKKWTAGQCQSRTVSEQDSVRAGQCQSRTVSEQDSVRLAIVAQTLLPRFCNARLTLDAWHPKKLATSDA